MALRIGVIGGSGLYAMEGLAHLREEVVTTPFGDPSDAYMIGAVEGLHSASGEPVELVFLPRHGRGHRFTPTEVNYRANVFGMKKLGVGWIVSISAVGSPRWPRGARRRHLRVHGGPRLLDPRREQPAPLLGRQRHRHDQHA